MKPDLRMPKALLAWQETQGVTADVKMRMEYFVRKKKQRQAKKLKGAGAALFLAGFLLWGVPYVKDTSSASTPPLTRQILALQDGSQAELNARTRLQTDFRYGRRVVTLEEGEAFFSVAKDPAHPFYVKTPGGTVRVLGTAFNVRLTPDRKAEVTLVEGSVDFEDGGHKNLRPGEQIVTGELPRNLSARSLVGVLAWRTGYMALSGLTLQQAMDRLSSYWGKPVSVAPGVRNLQPGGSFPIDNAPVFFEALQGILPIRVTPTQEGYRIDPASVQGFREKLKNSPKIPQ